MISIIIPVFNNHDMTEACTEAVKANTRDCEIVLIDNGSDPAIEFSMVRNETNLGFPAAVNQGIMAATGDVIVILNNDVIVTPSWMTLMLTHLQNGWDMVGPVTNSISGPQQVLVDVYDDIEGLHRAAHGNIHKYVGKVTPWHRLVFYCVAIRREVIDKIGLLDEAYSPGNFEDDDYCMRAIEAGFKLGIAKDVYVHHFGSQTFRIMEGGYGDLMKRNSEMFMAKWKDKYNDLMKKGQAA